MAVSPHKVDHNVLAIVKMNTPQGEQLQYYAVCKPWEERDSIGRGEGEIVMHMLTTTCLSSTYDDSIGWLKREMRKWCRDKGITEVDGLDLEEPCEMDENIGV